MLAQPPGLRAFVTPQRRQAVPTQRVSQLLPPGRYHATDTGSHFWSKRNCSAATIYKNKSLLGNDFLAGFAHIKLHRLDARSITFLVTESFYDAAHHIEHIFLQSLIFGVKVPRTFIALSR